jgi:hypothetical protein
MRQLKHSLSRVTDWLASNERLAHEMIVRQAGEKLLRSLSSPLTEIATGVIGHFSTTLVKFRYISRS